MHIRQAEVAPRVAVGPALVAEAKPVEEDGLITRHPDSKNPRQ